jgi:RNA polymerase sigma factor (sigma-70 family)
VTVSADEGAASDDAVPASPRPGRAVTTPSDAFTSAYRDYAPRVLGYLRMRGVDDPESVTQDVFLALYARIQTVKGGDAGVRSLVFSIAHARFVDHLRAVSRRPAARPYEPERDPRTSESAEDQVITSAGEREAWDRLQELGDEQREVIALRVVAGLTLAETALVMGRSDGAIKQLQRRALENLRARMTVRNGDD